MNVRLLLVDDHPLMLSGLRAELGKVPHFIIVGEAATGELALTLARDLLPDLVVMEAHLSDMNGIEATRQLHSAVPTAEVIIFSGDIGAAVVDEALEAGAGGYIFKRSSAKDLIHAINEVMAGRLALSPELSAAIVRAHHRTLVGEVDSTKAALSERENQLLRLVAKGLRNKEIASELKLSVNSIETYRSRLMKKIGCATTAELVRFAIREGIAVP